MINFLTRVGRTRAPMMRCSSMMLKPQLGPYRGLRIISALQDELDELNEDPSIQAPIAITDILKQGESPFELLSESNSGDIVLKNGNVSISMDVSEYEHSGEQEAAVPFLVYITGADNQQMTLSCVARSNEADEEGEVEIEQMVVEPSDGSKPDDPYSPSIGELDEELQTSIFEYINARGIDDNLAMSLVDIAEQKETQLYSQWVISAKSFIEKENAE